MKKSSKSSSRPAPAKTSAAPVHKAPVPATPVVKKTAAKPFATTICAWIDVGFGNALYVRGDGPGLSWEKGVAMECTGDDRWTLVITESARPLVFKFLLNDEVWSTGEDYTANAGAQNAYTPAF